jgi:LysM repeat protein
VRLVRLLTWVLVALLAVLAVAWALVVADDYRDRIYPGVSIEGPRGGGPSAAAIDVGGLTQQAARDRLGSQLTSPDSIGISLVIGEKSWQLAWSTVGQSYDINEAVARAFAVGRMRTDGEEQPWWLGFTRVLRRRATTVPVSINPADPALIRTHIEQIADSVATAPRDADLVVVYGQVDLIPAQAGQWLEVDEATAQAALALGQGSEQVTLVLNSIPPQIPTAEPALSQAQELLSQPFVVVVSDPLTGDPDLGGFHTEFSAGPAEIASWLRPLKRQGRITLNFDTGAVRDWVQEIAPLIGEGREMAVDSTAARILETLRTGDPASNDLHQTQAVVRHPPSTYTVQAGDTFYDIAYVHGFPQWRLEQANPDVDPGLIDIGQVLAIPSLDVLFPHPLVPGKRIEIDLPTQTLRAFDGDSQRFEFQVSSGISTTPTLAGQFQILFKEDIAFAQRWHLDMPYFMAFYEEGEDYFNGLHELPITSYGTRLSQHVLGWPASYGCIILDVGDAEALYSWADVGTLVRVHGVAPGTPFGQETLLDIAPLIEQPAP